MKGHKKGGGVGARMSLSHPFFILIPFPFFRPTLSSGPLFLSRKFTSTLRLANELNLAYPGGSEVIKLCRLS